MVLFIKGLLTNLIVRLVNIATSHDSKGYPETFPTNSDIVRRVYSQCDYMYSLLGVETLLVWVKHQYIWFVLLKRSHSDLGGVFNGIVYYFGI